MSHAIHAIASGETQAQAIVERLRAVGIADAAISLVFPDRRNARPTSGPGWLSSLRSLALGEAGLFFGIGPLSAQLEGHAADGIRAALIDRGLHQDDAGRQEQLIRGGQVLIAVEAVDDEQEYAAEQVFYEEDATEVSTAPPALEQLHG